MRMPLGWLSEWIDLPESQDELGERLTSAGLEIEEVIEMGADLSAFVVGAVTARDKHPDADKLSVCTVDVGQGEPLAIVCGAPNVDAGQRVAVALHGTVMPDGMKIKRSKIRGVKSNGMICSSRELGLGDEHDGILVLETDAAPGTSLSDVVDSGETVFDLEVTPNRGDWVSMLGMAREVRANFGGVLRMPELEPQEGDRLASDDVEVAIEDREGCSRYIGRVVRGIKVGPSPDWLVARLEAGGVRSISNVVDVTNLVMLELGQPLHAFDLAKLKGPVRVRRAEPSESLRTLDDQVRKLETDDMVIADDSGAIAIAGVMGGGDSEVSDSTTDVLIESARFNPSRVRRTARRLGLHSDASYRFERGVDPEGQSRAAARAGRLLAELGGGIVSSGEVEALGEPVPVAEPIPLDPARVNRLLGTRLSKDEIIALLARVDVTTLEAGETLSCQPPRYRGDLHLPEDLIEEVARIYGYDAIEATLPGGAVEGTTLPPRRQTVQAVKDSLVASGLTEIMTAPWIPANEPDALRLSEEDPRRKAVRLQNPIHADRPGLRAQLVGSALRIAQSNLSRQADALRIFECCRVFAAGEVGALPEERFQAVVLISAPRDPALWERSETPVFYQAKGVVERLLGDFGQAFEFRAGETEPFLHPGASGDFRVAGQVVAHVGELHPETARRFELEPSIAVALIDVDTLDAVGSKAPQYREVSRHPRVQRDLAVLLDAGVPAGEILEAIKKKAGGSLQSARVFDRYEGKGVPEGKVSVAFRLVFQRSDRTLTEPEVAKSTDRVVELLSRQFGGELR
jgi:phenylalanyl-tRNA synthetase beta chain